MATNEIQTTIGPMKGTEEKKDIFGAVKGFFKKLKGGEKKEKSRLMKSFTLNRRDAIISLVVALIVVAGVIVYGLIVYEKYSDMNDNKNSLKSLSSYEMSVDKDVLRDYVDGTEDIATVVELSDVNEKIQQILDEREDFKKTQKDYYEVLLQNIYLPSLNVWKNPYTKNFDMTVLGQRYLEKNKFQDLYLLQYWSNFVKDVGNDADYNVVNSVTLGGDVVELPDSDYFYVPITVEFTSPNKRSFLLLVNKLSVTSNTNNIALLNEFFFHLFTNIKNDKKDEIEKLMQEYRTEMSSSSNWDGPSSMADMDEDQLKDYQAKVIGYYLYQWVNYEGTGDNKNLLIDDEIIKKTIRNTSSCSASDKDKDCFYKFRNKYRDLPYLAYQVGFGGDEKDKYRTTTRTQGLQKFLRELPPVIAVTNFGFDKHVSQDLFGRDEQYEGSVTFNAYGRGISDDDLKEAAVELGKLCFGDGTEDYVSPDLALSRVNERIESLGGLDSSVNVSSLGELHDLFFKIQSSYQGMSNYNKMVKLFELWRMLNDANLCND